MATVPTKIRFIFILIVCIIILSVFTSCKKNNASTPTVTIDSATSTSIPISTPQNTPTNASSEPTINYIDDNIIATPYTQNTFTPDASSGYDVKTKNQMTKQEVDKTHIQNSENKEGYLTGNLVDDIIRLFPEGQVDVKVMKVGVPPQNRKRYDEILNKIINQYEIHKEQFNEKYPYDFGERINELKDGNINYFITWDPILGVNKNEVNELQQLKDFYMTSKGVINIERKENNIFNINTVKNVNNVNTVKIDLSNKTISTDYGVYNYVCFRKNYTEPPKVIADKWNLHEWTIDSKTSDNPYLYPSLYIGQIVKTKEIIIFLRTISTDNIIYSFSPKI